MHRGLAHPDPRCQAVLNRQEYQESASLHTVSRRRGRGSGCEESWATCGRTANWLAPYAPARVCFFHAVSIGTAGGASAADPAAARGTGGALATRTEPLMCAEYASRVGAGSGNGLGDASSAAASTWAVDLRGGVRGGAGSAWVVCGSGVVALGASAEEACADEEGVAGVTGVGTSTPSSHRSRMAPSIVAVTRTARAVVENSFVVVSAACTRRHTSTETSPGHRAGSAGPAASAPLAGGGVETASAKKPVTAPATHPCRKKMRSQNSAGATRPRSPCGRAGVVATKAAPSGGRSWRPCAASAVASARNSLRANLRKQSSARGRRRSAS
jgi:hypothetical protein